jgi:hypothetical protein
MATDNRGVMVYLPSELEAKIAEYCTDHNITRKDKHGNIITSLGTGVVAYLKSQLLGDIPRALSNRPNLGLTKDEVLDLIAKSNTSNGLIDRSPDPIEADVLHRLETVERSLSSSVGIDRDEVEQLIQSSRQEIMLAVTNIFAELRREMKEVATTDDRVNSPQPSIDNSSSPNKAMVSSIESPADTNTASVLSGDKPMTRDISRWLKRLKEDEQFRAIIQTGISEKLKNKVIVTRLFDAGYGQNDNKEPYTHNLASAMKTAFSIEFG